MNKRTVSSSPRLFLLALIGLMLYTCVNIPYRPYFESGVAKDNLSSAVQIEIIRSDGSVAQGSGFFVTKDGVGVSSYHVFKNTKSAKIITEDSLYYPVSAILAFSPENDLILFKVDSLQTMTDPVVISSREVRRGEGIVVISSPFKHHNTVTSGIVSGFTKENTYKRIQIDAPISSGSSGGMVLNKYGELISVVCAYHQEGQNLNFSIPAEEVTKLYYQMSPMELPSVYLREIRNQAKDYYYDGNGYFKIGDYEKAFQLFNLATETDPSYARGFFGKGRIFKEYGDSSRGLALFSKAKKIYLKNRIPSTAPEFFFCGEIAWESNQISVAKTNFEQATILWPDHAPTHCYLGLIAMLMKEWEVAEFEFQMAINADSGNPKYYRLLATLYLELDRIEAAENIYHQLNDIDPVVADYIWQIIHP